MFTSKKNMVNYSKGKIYKLVNSIDDQIYIGSSCTRLSDRKSQHKVTSRRHPNRSVYKHLNLVGWENVEIILIENVNCNNKEQLHSRERHYIELLKPSLNKQIPLRSQKEWFQDNPNYLKQYYQANKESINEHKKKKYSCECGGKFTHCHRSQHSKSKKHCNYEYQKIYDFIYS